MAEQTLYGYKDDPVFPYAYVAKHISWVPEFINNLTPLRARDGLQAQCYHFLINILLVFCRARTSTIVNPVNYKPPLYTVFSTFVARLNRSLERVPDGGGRLHNLEIFRYTRVIWFVTTRYSPRFIWGKTLTHREVGLNLDYYGAGHLHSYSIDLTSDNRPPKYISSIVEMSGNAVVGIVIENLFPEHVPDLTLAADFFRRKEGLLNTSMSRLNLPYRFKWFWEPPGTWKEINTVIQDENPPSKSWWEENVYFVNVPTKSGCSFVAMTFCSTTSRYDEFWPLVQEFYNWMLLHKLNDDSWRYPRYWERLESLFSLVRSVLDGEISYGDTIKQRIHASMVELAEFHGHILAGTCDPNEPLLLDLPHYRYEPYLVYKWRRWVAIVKMHFSEPWKKAPRRTFAEVDYPADPGDAAVGTWNQWKWGDVWKI